MNKITFIIKITIILSLITGCGFKVVKKSDFINYKISEIETIGERKINYKIRNNLLLDAKEDKPKVISIILNTTKDKTIKEKNSNNEITKYLIGVNVIVNFKEIGKDNAGSFSLSKSGEYSVNSQHSQTLNNEKKATDLIIKDISDEILDELSTMINAT